MNLLDIDPTEATRPTVESVVLAWRAMREERLEADKVAAALKKQEVAMKEWLILAMMTQKYEGVIVGGKATGVSTKEVPSCEDRPAFTQYVLEHEALELLEFRISKKAIEERVDAGEEIPGIVFREVYDLYNRKS